jgi:hypothetical protein
LRRYRQRLLQVTATTYSARAFQVGMGLALDIGALLVFGIAAILFFFSWWLDYDLRRIPRAADPVHRVRAARRRAVRAVPAGPQRRAVRACCPSTTGRLVACAALSSRWPRSSA